MENDPGDVESRPSGAAKFEGDLEESNRLFEAATREWNALAESLRDLKCELEPKDFATALAHMKIPGLEKLVRDWRKAQVEYEAVLSSAPTRRLTKPATASSDSARETRKRDAEATPPAREPAAERATASTQPAPTKPGKSQDGPDETTEIQRQLTELTTLLRQHVALTNDQISSSAVEIPKQLTLKIAQEVAGHVKHSVLETLRANETDRAANSTADRQSEKKKKKKKSEKKSERVPLEDVAAMIDQLTRF